MRGGGGAAGRGDVHLNRVIQPKEFYCGLGELAPVGQRPGKVRLSQEEASRRRIRRIRKFTRVYLV